MGPEFEIRRRAPRRAPAGLTLLELIVTLFVLALATALVMPAIGRGTESIRARADVSRFSALLRHAREQAITARRPHEVLIDPVARRVSVKAGADDPRPVLTLPERIGIPYRALGAALAEARISVVITPNDFAGLEKLRLEAGTGLELIAAGGIQSGYDVARALSKGARAVQVGSALLAEGPAIFARLAHEMRVARGERGE